MAAELSGVPYSVERAKMLLRWQAMVDALANTSEGLDAAEGHEPKASEPPTPSDREREARSSVAREPCCVPGFARQEDARLRAPFSCR